MSDLPAAGAAETGTAAKPPAQEAAGAVVAAAAGAATGTDTGAGRAPRGGAVAAPPGRTVPGPAAPEPADAEPKGAGDGDRGGSEDAGEGQHGKGDGARPGVSRGVFRRSLPFLTGHRAALAAAVGLQLGGAGLAVGVTAAIGGVIGAAGAGDRDRLLSRLSLLLALVVLSGVLAWFSRYWLIRVGEQVLAGMRERATAAVGAAPLRFAESHRRGELLRRLTGEIDSLAAFAGTTLPDLAAALTVLVFTAVMLALHSWPLTALLLLAFLPPAVVVVRGFHTRAGPAYEEVAEAEAAVAATFAETLPAQEQLRISGAVPRWLERFAADNERLLRAQRTAVRAELRLNRLSVLQAVCTAGLLVLCALLVGRDAIGVGVAVVFVLATRDIFNRFEDVAGAIGDAREAQVRLGRLLALIAAAGAPVPPGARPAVPRTRTAPVRAPGTGSPAGGPLPARGALTLSGAWFAYPGGEPVFAGLSLSVEPGGHLVVAGETGSGKSTLGKVLAGLYLPDRGSVAYAGRELSALGEETLRSRVVLVPQEVLLTEGTLAENLGLLPARPSRERMLRVLETLGLGGWAASLPQGLDTPAGAGALSAGERQLVAIARAVLADPAVLILDEATAGVDRVTAARIEDALAAAGSGRVLVVIAHRPETIARGSLLLTMPGGELTVGDGGR
jgi:ATP-binding cassette, subfamily B, bacterial